MSPDTHVNDKPMYSYEDEAQRQTDWDKDISTSCRI